MYPGSTFVSYFINGIFFFINNGTLYTYADDNTLSFCNPDYDILISTLESESVQLIHWFKVNKMHANPDKLQDLAVDKKAYNKNMCIHILSCESTLNFLV